MSKKFDFPTRVAFYDSVLERAAEIAFALTEAMTLPGRAVLDVGVGEFPSLWYALMQSGFDARGIDVIKEYFAKLPAGLRERLFYDDIVNTRLRPDSFDGVLCVSTLEHIPDWKQAVLNMRGLCKHLGKLVFTLPFSHSSPCENIKTKGKLTRVFSFAQVQMIQRLAGSVVRSETYRCWDGLRWRDGQRLSFPQKDRAVPDLVCFSCVVKK